MVASLVLSCPEAQDLGVRSAKTATAVSEKYRLPRLGFGAALKRHAGARELKINKMEEYARTMDVKRYREALREDLGRCWSASGHSQSHGTDGDWVVVSDNLPKVHDVPSASATATPQAKQGPDAAQSSLPSSCHMRPGSTEGGAEDLLWTPAVQTDGMSPQTPPTALSTSRPGSVGFADLSAAEQAKCNVSALRVLSSQRSARQACTRSEHLKSLLQDVADQVPSLGLLVKIISTELDVLMDDVKRASRERMPVATTVQSRTYTPEVVKVSMEALAQDLRQLQVEKEELQGKLDCQAAVVHRLETEKQDLQQQIARFEQQLGELAHLTKASHVAIFDASVQTPRSKRSRSPLSGRTGSPTTPQGASPFKDPSEGTLLAKRAGNRRSGEDTYDIDDTAKATQTTCTPEETTDMIVQITSECQTMKTQNREYKRVAEEVVREYNLCMEENEELKEKLMECVDQVQEGKQQRRELDKELRTLQFEMEKFETERRLDKYGKACNQIRALNDDILHLLAMHHQLVHATHGLVGRAEDAQPEGTPSGLALVQLPPAGRLCGRETRQSLSFRIVKKKDKFMPYSQDNTLCPAGPFPVFLRTKGDRAPKLKVMTAEDVKGYITEFFDGGREPEEDYRMPFNPSSMRLVAMDRAFEKWATGKFTGQSAPDCCYSIAYTAAREALADADHLIFLRTIERTLPFNFRDYVAGCLASLHEALAKGARGGVVSLKDFLHGVEEGFPYKSSARLTALAALCLQYPDGLKENVPLDTLFGDASPLANELKRQFVYEHDDVMLHIRRSLVNTTEKFSEENHIQASEVLQFVEGVVGDAEYDMIEKVVESQVEAGRRYRVKLAAQGMAVSARLANARSQSRAGLPESPRSARSGKKGAMLLPPEGFCATAAENTFPLSTFLRAIACTVVLKPLTKTFTPDFERLGVFEAGA